MLRKRLILPLLLCFFLYVPKTLYAQDSQSIFLELGGYTDNYSLNYTRAIHRWESVALEARIGLSILERYIGLPLGIQLHPYKTIHQWNISLGMVPFQRNYQTPGQKDSFMDIVIGGGYRLQPTEESWYGMIMLYPFLRLDPAENNIWDLSPEAKFTFGISLGYNF